MKVSLENIANLKNSSSYYLADNGDIKKSGLIHKFKCFFDLGHSRQRVANLITAIQKSFTEKAGVLNIYSLNQDLKTLDTSSALSGKQLREIATRFKTQNANLFFKKEAIALVNEITNKFISELQTEFPDKIKDTAPLKSFLQYEYLDFFDRLPLKEENGEKSLDRETYEHNITATLSERKALIAEVLNSEKLNVNVLDDSYVNYIKSVACQDGELIVHSTEKFATYENAVRNYLIDYLGKSSNATEADRSDRVDLVLNLAKKDERLYSILMVSTNFKSIFLTNTAQLRSADEVKNRINGFYDNLQDFKAYSNDPLLYKSLNNILHGLVGKPLVRGMDVKIHRLVEQTDFNDLFKLNANSSVEELSKALANTNVLVDKIMNDSGIRSYADGPDTLVPYKQLIMSFVLAKAGPEQRHNMLRALESTNYHRLASIFSRIDNDEIELPNNMKASEDMIVRNMVEVQGTKNALELALCEFMGVEQKKELPDYVLNDIPNKTVRNVLTDLMNTAKTLVNNAIENVVETNFKGIGTKIKEQIKKSMNDAFYSHNCSFNDRGLSIFNTMMEKDLGTMINYHLLLQIKNNQNNEVKNALFRENVSNINVTLPGGQILSKNYETACDELAVVITGNKDAKYLELDETDKRKTELIMAMLTKESAKSIRDTQKLALSPNRTEPLFTVSEAPGKQTTVNFTVTKDPTGTIGIVYQQQTNIAAIIQADSSVTQANADTSYDNETTVIDFSKENLNQIANLDVKDLDTEKLEAMYNRQGEYSNLEKKMDAIYDEIKPEYRISPAILKHATIMNFNAIVEEN